MESTRPKYFVFVLMPFEDSFTDIYKLGIQATCKEIGAYCERIDEQIFQESILERIYNQISKADLIIADMSGRNPNVFYEVGYAHALGKNVILLTQNTNDIPFDLKHYPHIVYENKIVKLKEELSRRVRWFMDHPSHNIHLMSNNLRVMLNRKFIENDIEIVIYESNFPVRWFLIEMDLYNDPSTIIKTINAKIGIITPTFIESLAFEEDQRKRGGFSSKTFLHDDKYHLHIEDHKFEILPGGYFKIFLEFFCINNPVVQKSNIPITIRSFLENGYSDINANLILEKKI